MTDIRSAIPDYAGHADASARRLSDQQVRAWVGERLAALRERILAAASDAAFDDLILHCEFGDQAVIKALEDERFADGSNAATVESEDRAMLAAASKSESVDGAALPAFIEALTMAFHHRSETIIKLGPTSLRRAMRTAE